MLRIWIIRQLTTAELLLAVVGDGGQGMEDLELKCLCKRCCWLALAPKEPHTPLYQSLIEAFTVRSFSWSGFVSIFQQSVMYCVVVVIIITVDAVIIIHIYCLQHTYAYY